MDIKVLVVGALQENCYVCSIGNNAFIVDPGDEADRIIDACMGKNVVEIIVTHHHFDHIGALDELKKYYKLEENVKSGMFDYEIIETLGHTSDSRSIYFKNEKVMFTGDFLFYRSIGRTDFIGGNVNDMFFSLEKVLKLSDSLIVLPGHGAVTTMEKIKNCNPYVKRILQKI